MAKEGSAEATIRDIKRKTRRTFSAEEKIRIVNEGLRGEESMAELCRREGIAESLYYSDACPRHLNHDLSTPLKCLA